MENYSKKYIVAVQCLETFDTEEQAEKYASQLCEKHNAGPIFVFKGDNYFYRDNVHVKSHKTTFLEQCIIDSAEKINRQGQSK